MKSKALILVMVPILVLAFSLPCFGYDSSLKNEWNLRDADEHPWGGEANDIGPGIDDPDSPSYTFFNLGFLTIDLYNIINQIRNETKDVNVNDDGTIETEIMVKQIDPINPVPSLETQQKGN
jgi:hypothetical protein